MEVAPRVGLFVDADFVSPYHLDPETGEYKQRAAAVRRKEVSPTRAVSIAMDESRKTQLSLAGRVRIPSHAGNAFARPQAAG